MLYCSNQSRDLFPYSNITTLGNPFAYWDKRNAPLLLFTVKMFITTGLTSTGEHLQSDLDIFQFDFMFVKPYDLE